MSDLNACVACERPMDGEVSVTIDIHFPVTGRSHKGTMHLACAIVALQELRRVKMEQAAKNAQLAGNDSASKPS